SCPTQIETRFASCDTDSECVTDVRREEAAAALFQSLVDPAAHYERFVQAHDFREWKVETAATCPEDHVERSCVILEPRARISPAERRKPALRVLSEIRALQNESEAGARKNVAPVSCG